MLSYKRVIPVVLLKCIFTMAVGAARGVFQSALRAPWVGFIFSDCSVLSSMSAHYFIRKDFKGRERRKEGEKGRSEGK